MYNEISNIRKPITEEIRIM